MSAALGEAIGESLLSREYFDARRTADRQYLDLRLGETEVRLRGEIAEAKTEILKWMFGMIGFQTVVILGGDVHAAPALTRRR